MDAVVVAGPLERREALVAPVKEAEASLRDPISNVEHLDVAITMFKPDHRPVAPQVRYAGHGQVTRMVLTILRKSSEPMTLRALSLKAMESLGLATGNKRKVRKMGEQLRTALMRQRENGVVVCEPGKGAALLWQVTPQSGSHQKQSTRC
jgi:hypothetical protein